MSPKPAIMVPKVWVMPPATGKVGTAETVGIGVGIEPPP